MSWQNVSIPDEVQLSFPFIQWVNNGNSLDPRRPRGGFGMPEEQIDLAGDYPKDAELHKLILKSGEEVPMAFTHTLRAAVLATRFAWILDGKRTPTYVKGARSKLQALAIVEGQDAAFIAVLTFSGMAGKEFSDALKKHAKRVRRLTRAAGKEQSHGIFYATYTADEPKMVGRTAKSQITPVALGDEEFFDLDTAFVGEAALAQVDWDQVKAWKEAWGKPGINGDGEVEDSGPSGPSGQEERPSLADRVVAEYQEFQEWISTRLPFRSKKYGEATVGDLYNAGDVEALKALIAWCKDRPNAASIAAAAEAALEALESSKGSEGEEIPF
ncbi:MAG TPA: hypothetical protein EYP77_06320 [Anaerolineae bacterium]|nr:hypothetical protein [Anaerolineae bacterium]